MEAYIIKRMMHQDFKIRVFTGISTKGEKNYDPAIDIKGYYVGKTKIVMDVTGQQVLSTGHFFVTAEDFVKITLGSAVETPLSTAEYPVLLLEPFYKERNILSFGVVYLK